MRENEKKFLEGLIMLKGRRGGILFDEEHDIPIEIRPENLNTALHEDRVRVLQTGKTTGKVTEILSRARTDFVGTIEKDIESKDYTIKPYDYRFYPRVLVAAHDLLGAQEGDRVLVELSEWNDPKKRPSGKVTTIIGKAGVHESEIQSIILDKGLALTFSRETLKEADEIKKSYPGILPQEIKARREYREVATFTIDPETAKDFDDALSIKKLPNENFEVGIHIADPSFFIKPGSAIDKHARTATTSVYLVDRTIPMLPEVLSNDLCSLNPHEDKLTFSAIFEMTPHAKVVNKWFGKTVTHSKKRFSYEDAQKIINKKEGIFYEELSHLNALAKKLKEGRKERGALEFEQDEISFILDKDGKPISIFKKERLEAHKLIEEFMILANNKVAQFMSEYDKRVKSTFVYRVHDVPDEDKMQELLVLLRALKYPLPKKTRELGLKEIDEILSAVKNTPHEELVNMAVLRGMAKAIYSTKNTGHFGLSLSYYTHFTSPIRRYPDIMVHRLLFSCLTGKKIPEKELQEYESLSRYATQMEILATQAERESIKYKQTEYMERHIGEERKGTITGFSEGGMFVRENETLSEGMIRLSDLHDDYYSLDESGFFIVGRRKKKKYSLGDAVHIKVKNVNVERRLIDYELVL
ncbi:MAG: ribonuclease R [Candidatus Paceibacterota bacterium]